MSDNLSKVKELRELTGAGIQDCKTALSENNFDIEKSIEYLRKKGISKAAKKSSRDAAEGLAVVASNNSKACILEINSETDFVAKNNEFINFCSEVSKIALVNNFNLAAWFRAELDEVVVDGFVVAVAAVLIILCIFYYSIFYIILFLVLVDFIFIYLNIIKKIKYLNLNHFDWIF